MNDLIGTVLGGRYEILELVGKGGMAYVYKARCHLLNRIVAVKVLRNDLEGGDEFIERFNTEAQSAAGLTHPNIVSIYDVGKDKGYHYIVMEYIDGITLKEYIHKKGKIGYREAAYIASQICHALEAAHEKNIVHRDIKPHNIMITSDNRVKVTDFGIARASSNATMSVGDVILGSVHYISPEQARGGYVDCKSDIYSLGIVLYEMLTGRVPFESESPIAVAMKHLEEKPIPPCEIDPSIPPELQEIVLKAICKETRNRYQTVSAFCSDLEAIMPQLEDAENENAVTGASDDTMPINISGASDNSGADDTADETGGNGGTDDEYDEEYDDDDDETDDGKKHSVVNTVFAAVLIALLVVGGISLGVTKVLYPDLPIFNLFSNKDIKVPNFVGKDYDEAEKTADKCGLVLEVGDRITSAEPENTVVKQNTAKGRKVKKGETILVYVSSGPEDIDTEEYIGKNADDVISELEEMGYKVTVKKKSDTDVAEGCIISMKQNGSKITINVSKGLDGVEIVVPNCVGKTIDAAEKLLDSHSLTLGKVEYVESDIYNPGTVINQDISSGETVDAKTKINLTVARKKTDSKDDKKTDSESTGSSTHTNTKTLSISLPTDRSSVAVKVVSKPVGGGSESVVFPESTINTSERPEVVLKVSGTGKNEFTIYFDGAVASKKIVDFSE